VDEFNLLGDITIGQYVPGDSLIHRFDARAKILAVFALCAAVSATESYLGTLVVLACILALVPLAGIPLGYALRGLRPALPVLLIFLAFQLLFQGNSETGQSPMLAHWSAPFALGPVQPSVTITETSLRRAIVFLPRVVCYWVLVSLLTFTTTTSELAHAVEGLLGPFRLVRLPAHEIAMTVTIALRFVPTLAEETETLMKAQASRGADFGRPGGFRFLQAARNLIPILVPLFVLTFRRAEELIYAMESRCYIGGSGRTNLVQLRMRRLDWLLLMAAGAGATVLGLTHFPF
jgi:energy-coupling factor transport system permease protein